MSGAAPIPGGRSQSSSGCSAIVTFGFLGGNPTGVALLQREMTPLLSVSTTLLANSSMISLASGCPPCWRKRQSRNVHQPKTLDQQRNGHPLECTYCGSVGRSICFFPAAWRSSAKCTQPLDRLRYADIIVFSLGGRLSCQFARQSQGW